MTDELNIHNRARYAVLAMIEIACASRPIPVHAISTATNVSKSYLEQLVATLRERQLVTATHGPGGGYTLTRPASEITIAEISDAARNWAPGGKKQSSPIEIDLSDPSQLLWSHVGKRMHVQLQSITLEDVISRRLEN